MGGIFQQAIGLTGTFNLWIILIIFAINMFGEFGFSIPYLMETIWLIVGYHVIGGTIPPEIILLFCVISLIGREVGAGMLYKISGYGRSPLLRMFHRIIQNNPGGEPLPVLKRRVVIPIARLVDKFFMPHSMRKIDKDGKEIIVQRKPFCPSTFNVVLGRLYHQWIYLH